MKNNLSSDSEKNLQKEIEDLKLKNQQLQEQLTENSFQINQLSKFKAENETKSRFLANIAQEIRNPLSSIIGFSQIIQRDMRLGFIEEIPEYSKFLDNIENSGQYLSEIINSIIDISEIEKGETSCQESDIDLIKFFKNLFYVNKIGALKKQIDLKYNDFSSSLPEYIRSDRRKLEKILNYIIDNAVKFTPAGKAITISLSIRNKLIEFRIKDEGIGIPEEYLKSIFEPFQKVPLDKKNQQQGIGLGLSVAKAMAHILNGSIEVESQLNKGSIFTIKVPYQEPKKKVDVNTYPDEELIFSKENRVLVVEDNLITQELIAKIFSIFDLKISFVNNGSECLDELSQVRPDIILMDIYMPVMNGLKATEEIRKIPEFKDTPVIGLSSGGTKLEKKRAISAGMTDYLVKPINLDALLPILGKYLRTEKNYFDITDRQQQKVRLLQHTSKLQSDRYLQEKQLDERTKALLSAKTQAEQANRSKSEFLANISHELRTPMHQILSFAKFGEDKHKSEKRDKLGYYFQKIRSAGGNLMLLLNDLLDLSKLEAGKTQYLMLPYDIREIIKNITQEFSPQIKEKKHTIQIQSSQVKTEVICDEQKIGQVVRNIISNAIKFTPENKKISINFETTDISTITLEGSFQKASGLVVHIEDQGVGIPVDELDSVFDKFVQSSKTRTGAGGTGLGLAICFEIIKAHCGKIWVNNNQPEGSIFSFMIPYEQSEDTM